jgi:transposase
MEEVMAMKSPAKIESWLSLDELSVWVREAPDREAYQKRLVIWMITVKKLHAHEIADMLQVSKQAVWLWVSQYNKNGPEGLERTGRGGRRWAFLGVAEEDDILRAFEKRASKGEVLTAKQIKPEVEKALGKKVSDGYIYRLLKRHNWRKVAPRPHHVKADHEAQEQFKKNSRKSSGKH